MTQSNPSLTSVDIPSETPPNNAFTVNVDVRQGGPSPLGSFTSGGCITQKADVQGWVTPVTVWVDEERVATRELCLASGNSKETTMTVSVGSGQHTVAVRVHPVGDVHGIGQTWEDNLDVVSDEVVQTVTGDVEARDPSRMSAGGAILEFFEDLANRIGTNVNMLALGIVAGVAVFLVI